MTRSRGPSLTRILICAQPGKYRGRQVRFPELKGSRDCCGPRHSSRQLSFTWIEGQTKLNTMQAPGYSAPCPVHGLGIVGLNAREMPSIQNFTTFATFTRMNAWMLMHSLDSNLPNNNHPTDAPRACNTLKSRPQCTQCILWQPRSVQKKRTTQVNPRILVPNLTESRRDIMPQRPNGVLNPNA
jgi:hypothetical protein